MIHISSFHCAVCFLRVRNHVILAENLQKHIIFMISREMLNFKDQILPLEMLLNL